MDDAPAHADTERAGPARHGSRPGLLAQVLDQVGEGVAVFDDTDCIVYANAALAALHECEVSDLLGRHLATFIDAPQQAARERADDEAAGKHLVRVELSSSRLDGSRFEAELTVSALRAEDGSRAGTIVCVRDISVRKALEERLVRSALHDALTDLPNRRLFTDRLDHALAGAARTGSTVAVLFIDLDGFKAVNDTHGHDAGDQLLVQVADRLRSCLRAGDTLARLGGDEFVILLGDAQGPQEPCDTARRLLQQLQRPFHLDSGVVRVNASIGVALSTSGAQRSLLSAADHAMYRAKRTGGGRIVVEEWQTCSPAEVAPH